MNVLVSTFPKRSTGRRRSDRIARKLVIALSIILILLAVLSLSPISQSQLIPPPIPIEYGEPPPVVIMP